MHFVYTPGRCELVNVAHIVTLEISHTGQSWEVTAFMIDGQTLVIVNGFRTKPEAEAAIKDLLGAANAFIHGQGEK